MEHAIRIDAPIERVFGIINHPWRAADWFCGLSEVADVSDKTPKVGTTYRWHFKMAGIRFPGRSVYQEITSPRHILLRGEGAIPHTMEWNLAPEDRATWVRVVANYEIPKAALLRLANPLLLERINLGNLRQSLDNLKLIAEAEVHLADAEAEESA
jgi:uncharacterized protein YndB with AHSA1/START domain